MKFIADLHIHSKYSRATAKNLDLEHLYIEARKKGITVIGTGDSTHPGWFAELKEKLVPAEIGLFRLQPEIEQRLDIQVPMSCPGTVRFLLESEISSIYKKGGKTRKNHNLVFFPDVVSAERFNLKLDAIGNIRSDGRPILGLDAKDLFEILLETDPRSFLIPAHIWTPWFSLLGSKSGFDSLEECFEDLAGEIFAVETGLSSDPPMNWRVSFLDRLTLVSNSDAHSPSKLGREANLFDTDLSFPAIRDALKTGDPSRFLGTLEFFPEEGKYHHDGHRKCQVSLSPEESAKLQGICPVCTKPMTLGVSYRVLELADREEGRRPMAHHPFHSIIPLDEVLAEILNCGPKSKRVMMHLAKVVEKIGPEFSILKDISIADIKEAGIPLLGEAIDRIRHNKLHIQPGYDGEFGKIKIFTEEEKRELSGRKMLFACGKAEADPSFVKAGSRKSKGRIKKKDQPEPQLDWDKIATGNPEQERIIESPGGPLVVVAGPGTGKTYTLTQRIAKLITMGNALPETVLAITFTVKAAKEMKERLASLGVPGGAKVMTCTFHGLGHALLTEWQDKKQPFSILDDQGQRALFEDKLIPGLASDLGQTPQNFLAMIGSAKQNVLGPEDDLSAITQPFSMDPGLFAGIFASYQAYLTSSRLWDYDDLVSETVMRLEHDQVLLEMVRKRFSHVFVDEYQDVNHAQYRLVRILCPPGSNIMVIGDPDQAIYGFRGADSAYFRRFGQDYSGAQSLSLSRNYRSTDTILSGAFQMMAKGEENSPRTRVKSGKKGAGTITVFENPTERSEATAIGKCIEQLMGGTGFHSHDFQQEALLFEHDLGFSDFGILTRTHAQGRVIAEALEKGGIPCQHVSKEGFWSHPVLTHLLTGLKIIHDLPCLRQDMNAFESIFPKGFEALRCILSEQKELANQPLRAQLELLVRILPGCKKALAGKQVTSSYEQLLAMATPFKCDTADYLKTLYLSYDQDLFDLNAEKVSIMTMHASKGLEFEVVFVAGCEDGLLPYRKSGKTDTDKEEERRLFYVAMTRAKSLLFLSFAKKRMRFGKTEATVPSPFINDIDRQLLRFESPKFTRLEQENKPVQLSLF